MLPLGITILPEKPVTVLMYVNKCNSFLGVVYGDGLPPYFTRFSINSAAVEFVHKEWFEDPNLVRMRQKEEQERVAELEKRNLLDKDDFDEQEYLDVVGIKKRLG